MARSLFQTAIFEVEGFDVSTRAGERPYVRLRMPDWVNVVAITPDGEVVLVRQHRHGVDEATLEVPGGIVDPGEAPQHAALRELREETGYGGGVVSPLGWVWSNPAIQDNRTHMFLVEGAMRMGEPEPDPGEEIEVVLAPVDAIRALLDGGTIRHALAVVPLQRVLLARCP